MRTSFSFLAIGKTNVSTEAQESKKYIGVGSSFVLGVNPDKKQAEEWLGHELQNDPTYTNESDEVANIRLEFYVKTDPAVCIDEEGKGIEVVNRHSFFLKNQPATFEAQDGTKYATVIDKYGNSQLASYEDAKANKQLLTKNGAAVKIAPDYRIAYEGEAELIAFLKAYLGVEDAFEYKDSNWVLKTSGLDDYLFGLEHIKDYFKGDISEIKEALALQPGNKVKLLYGIRNTDKGQFQCIATETDLVLRNSAGTRALANLDKQLAYHNNRGNWAAKYTYEVCPLKEYKVTATDLNKPAEVETAAPVDAMPWN